MKITPLSTGGINAKQKDKNITVQPYSVVIPHLMDTSNINQSVCVPANNTKGAEYYVIPSFGSIINQTNSQCINATGGTIVDLTYNQSMYNGSVRLLWSSPNYGYFDRYTNVKPNPDSYLNYINPSS